jgi:hypothetical protein
MLTWPELASGKFYTFISGRRNVIFHCFELKISSLTLRNIFLDAEKYTNYEGE